MVRSVQLGLVAQRERRKKLRVFARPEARHSAQAAPSHDCPFAPTPADWPVLRNTLVGNRPTAEVRRVEIASELQSFVHLMTIGGYKRKYRADRIVRGGGADQTKLAL